MGRESTTASGHVVRMRCNRPLLIASAVLVAALPVTACGDEALSSSDLPRTTEQGITIEMVETVETLPVAGCHSYWGSRDEEPPPGACEATTTIREFTAKHGTETVSTSVFGEIHVDYLFAMQLVARRLAEGISVVLVRPPVKATVVQLVDSGGAVVDRVTPADRLVALACLGSDLTVEALSADGIVIAACPSDGVIYGGSVYPCTLAPGATIPITTTTFVDG